jgi:predicted TIM-barrel fold metal-dependent hydrolase
MHHYIDVHHHIIPPFYRIALEKQFGVNAKGFTQLPQWPTGGVKIPEWTWDDSEKTMAKHSIRSALTSISAPGVYFGDVKFAKNMARQCNEYAAEMSRTNPTKYGAFATLPLPDIHAALEELRYVFDVLKMDGIVLLSNYDQMHLGNSHFNPLYEALNERKAKVFIHPTTPTFCCSDMHHLPLTLFEFVCDTSRSVIHLLTAGVFDQFPNIHFIIPHAGGVIPYLAGRFKLYEKFLAPSAFQNTPKGVDHYLKRLFYDTAMATSPSTLRCLTDYVSCEQIVMGTDSPFVSDEGIRAVFDSFNGCDFISSDQKEMIRYKNLERLFPKFAKRHS